MHAHFFKFSHISSSSGKLATGCNQPFAIALASPTVALATPTVAVAATALASPTAVAAPALAAALALSHP